MPLYEPIIPYRYVAVLIALLHELCPRDAAGLLAQAGIDGDDLAKTDPTLPMSRFDRLLTVASAYLRRGDLGFEMGRRITLDTHGTLRDAIGRCRTLHEMLLLMERYYHLVTPSYVGRYEPGEHHCSWSIRVAAPMSTSTLHMSLEMHAISMHVDLRRLFGNDLSADIYLSAPPPPHVARYHRLPRTRFHFSSGALPEVRCVLPAELVHRPVPRTREGEDLAQVDIRPPSQSGLRLADRYGEWVELMLREAQAVQPTVTDLAGLLNVSPRTLRRRLGAEGINFRTLGARVRHERACALLADLTIPTHQIAYQLGYGDTTAFIRAFREAGHTTPARFRESKARPPGRDLAG